jgi:hypothetical protein
VDSPCCGKAKLGCWGAAELNSHYSTVWRVVGGAQASPKTRSAGVYPTIPRAAYYDRSAPDSHAARFHVRMFAPRATARTCSGTTLFASGTHTVAPAQQVELDLPCPWEPLITRQPSTDWPLLGGYLTAVSRVQGALSRREGAAGVCVPWRVLPAWWWPAWEECWTAPAHAPSRIPPRREGHAPSLAGDATVRGTTAGATSPSEKAAAQRPVSRYRTRRPLPSPPLPYRPEHCPASHRCLGRLWGAWWRALPPGL